MELNFLSGLAGTCSFKNIFKNIEGGISKMKPRILNVLFTVFSVLLIHSSVSYSQWFQLTTNITQNLQDICFINTSTGIAVGASGKIIRTTDAGQTWVTISSGTSNSLFSLVFSDNMTGFTGGFTGTVLRTLNGGASWNPRTGCGINIMSISFLNANTGITAGGGTLMCYTTDGGQNWNPRYLPQFAASSITFLNNTTLIASATDMPGAVIYKSTNSGYNFSTVLNLVNSGFDVMYSLSHIYFKDPATGFCTGNRSSYGQVYGTIYRTTNGGDNWQICCNAGPSEGNVLFGVHFGETSTGFAVGGNGIIMRSTNGGVNWSAQSSGVTGSLNAVYMLNELTGYVCGNNGVILKTTNGGVTGFINLSNEIPDKFCLYQNYPNPFNPSTKIRFDIPTPLSPTFGKGGRTQSGGFVKITILDVLGREIAVLVNERLKLGTYEVEWDGSNYPSGVYFYKLQTEEFTLTRKMVLLK
jgi:photosystem II stability/assembly factor-like uncharacterized protein